MKMKQGDSLPPIEVKLVDDEAILVVVDKEDVELYGDFKIKETETLKKDYPCIYRYTIALQLFKTMCVVQERGNEKWLFKITNWGDEIEMEVFKMVG